MFISERIKESNTVIELVVDEELLQVVLKDSAIKKCYELCIGEHQVVSTVKQMDHIISQLRDGEVRHITCNSTGVGLFVQIHSMEVHGEYFSRLNVISVNRVNSRLSTYNNGGNK